MAITSIPLASYDGDVANSGLLIDGTSLADQIRATVANDIIVNAGGSLQHFAGAIMQH